MNAFAVWLDLALTDIPSGVQAFNFNLYEGATTWDVELVGTAWFDAI